MNGLNQLILEGNVAHEPVLEKSVDGSDIGSLVVAVNRFYRNSARETVAETSFFDVACYGVIARLCGKLAAGEFLGALNRNEIHPEVKGKGEVTVINLDWVKWYNDFPEVREVDEVCEKLCKPEFDKEGYGFRMMILNEDRTTEESGNETGYGRFGDVCFECYISNPYDV